MVGMAVAFYLTGGARYPGAPTAAAPLTRAAVQLQPIFP